MPKMDLTTNKVAVGVITLIVTGWAVAITQTVTTVTGLEPQIDQIQTTLAQHDEWIADWPSTGELAADVRQSKDIEFLFQEMEETNAEIDEIKARLRTVEDRQARGPAATPGG